MLQIRMAKRSILSAITGLMVAAGCGDQTPAANAPVPNAPETVSPSQLASQPIPSHDSNAPEATVPATPMPQAPPTPDENASKPTPVAPPADRQDDNCKNADGTRSAGDRCTKINTEYF